MRLIKPSRPISRMAVATILWVTALLGTSAAQALPNTEGTTLADQRLVLADAIKAKRALLIITFSRAAGEKAAEWRKALRQKNLPPANFALYQVAHLEDVPRLIRWSVISGMRRGIPRDEHATFVILTKDADEWKKFVAFQNDDIPYLVTLDAAGKVKSRLSGQKSDALLA